MRSSTRKILGINTALLALASLVFIPIPSHAFGRLELRATPPVAGLDPSTIFYTIANGDIEQDLPNASEHSIVEVISDEAYKVDVEIFTNQGQSIRKLRYDMSRPAIRPENLPDGVMRSLIVWDQRTTQGQIVGHGVYLWKFTFSSMKNNRKSVRFLRTGVVRRS